MKHDIKVEELCGLAIGRMIGRNKKVSEVSLYDAANMALTHERELNDPSGHYATKEGVVLGDDKFDPAVELLDSLDKAGYTVVKKDALLYPPEINEAIARVFGQPNFETGPIARLYRMAGFNVEPRLEAEQAFVMDRFLRIVLQNPEHWGKAISDEIASIRTKAVTQKEEKRP